jgi:hypothetical protein
MVREPVPAPSINSSVLDGKYELLFGTENVYLFVRLYLLLCSMLDDIRAHVEAFGCSGDPSYEYWRPTSRFPQGPEAPRVDYSTLLTAALGFFSSANPNDDAFAAMELERVGRIVCEEKVYLVAALPGLVDRCVQALVATAREDVLLPLYDYCQHRRWIDPVWVRTHCFGISPSAVYRIQYDTAAGIMYFNYLPRSMDLLVSPPPEASSPPSESAGAAPNAESEADPIDEFSSEGENNHGGVDDDFDEIDGDHGAADADEAEDSSRPAKRAKVQ